MKPKQPHNFVEDDILAEMSKFCLSEKRQDRSKPKPVYNIRYTYSEEDVKEFIRQEELLIIEAETGIITFEEFWKRRKKLAGEKLTK